MRIQGNSPINSQLPPRQGGKVSPNEASRKALDTETSDKSINAILQRMGFALDQRNAALVKLLTKHGIAVNKGNMQILQGIMKHEGLIGHLLSGLVDKLKGAGIETSLLSQLFFVDLKEENTDYREKYREILQALSVVREKIKGMKGGRKELQQQIALVEKYIDFVAKINGSCLYVMFPFTYGAEENTAEIYVFSEAKNNGDREEQPVKLLLSLRTKSFGLVQAFLEVRSEAVSCDFRLEEGEGADLFRGYFFLLEELLKDKGFYIKNATVQARESFLDLLEMQLLDDKAGGKLINTKV